MSINWFSTNIVRYRRIIVLFCTDFFFLLSFQDTFTDVFIGHKCILYIPICMHSHESTHLYICIFMYEVIFSFINVSLLNKYLIIIILLLMLCLACLNCIGSWNSNKFTISTLNLSWWYIFKIMLNTEVKVTFDYTK